MPAPSARRHVAGARPTTIHRAAISGKRTKWVAWANRPRSRGDIDSRANTHAATTAEGAPSQRRPTRNTSTMVAALTSSKPCRMPAGVSPNVARMAAYE